MIKQKYFIITVDTEGDNLWTYKTGEKIGVENAKFLPRFQSLCEEYGFKPVYLTNFEMANCPFFVEKAKQWLEKENCEIGVHLHAWNNPPILNLEGTYNGNPYLIEYTDDIMEKKFDIIYNTIVSNFGISPVSHRAGRWAMDDRYFRLLEKYGIKVDCSHTPGINWSNIKGKTIGGSDYSKVSNNANFIGKVLEVPMTIVKSYKPNNGSIKHRLKTMVVGQKVWVRPASSNYKMMKDCIDRVMDDSSIDYVEFMIHSSEVMPNGSPYFPTADSVEKEYKIIRQVFGYAKRCGYIGCTLKEYYHHYTKK